MNASDLQIVDVPTWSKLDLMGKKQEWTPTQMPRPVTATANVNPLDDLILASGSTTLTLESAVGCGGRRHTVLKTDASNTLTIACTGSETLGGSSTKTLTVQYQSITVESDGENWQVIARSGLIDLTSGVTGTLPLANGGTGATTAAGARTALGLDNLAIPLMSYGGYGFDGSTDYLDGNALTGIADGKKFTVVGYLRFANAASANEDVIQNTGAQFIFRRTSTGNIQVVGENSAGTIILNIVTTGTPCSAAGTYKVMASGDLATAASARIYINDVQQTVTETTFTDDTIDYTVAEWSVGGSVTGTNLFTGDIYLLWFDPTSNLAFSTESVRRKFIDVNGVPVYLGKKGELPTGSSPILFLGYDDYTLWPKNRGSAVSTTFTENGTPGAATTALSGQFGDILRQGTTVASATAITLGAGKRFHISGTTTIDLINEARWLDGDEFTLHFDGSLTVTHAAAASGSDRPILLAGAANFSATANDQLTLQYDRARNFYEVARTVI